jgi:hypothetical protein
VETLAERIAREGPVNELDAVGWIVRLAKKLESMHARGLYHGAVCPEAMKTASASRLSLGMLVPTGAVRNRLEFRSPERLVTETMSAEDDTWGTAATLYALITGSSPFSAGDEDSIRQKIRSGTFGALSTFDVGDDDLQNIIEAALNPTMAQRTSSLAAFRTALEGWHPDAKVRELPPMVDEQPEDDDDDARTVMRPVSAADAVRTLMQQREQAAAARAPDTNVTAAKEILSNTNEPASRSNPGLPLANHGLLEDDDENAKTAMMAVSPLAYLNKITNPAAVPAPAAAAQKPPPAAARAPAGRPVSAKSTVVGGFTASELMAQAKAAMPPPVAAQPVAAVPKLGISREAVLEDVDNDATVMREAPVDVMRKAAGSIAPPGDRKTPVDPTSAAVAAMTATMAEIPTVKPPETSMSFGSISLVEEVSDLDAPAPAAPPARAFNPPPVAGAAFAPAASPARQTPPPVAAVPPPVAAPVSGLATSALTAPSTPGMVAPVVPAPTSTPPQQTASTPAMAAPEPAIAPLARAPVAPPPMMVPTAAPQPSAAKGLLIGVGLALIILAAAAAVYFLAIKP